MSSNLTHRKQLARTLAATSEMTYQQSLDLVTIAATKGLLPAKLDQAGMAAALRVLAVQPAVKDSLAGAFLVGGPYGSNVANAQGKSVRPTCDVCNRKILATEPWWMVRAANMNWANDAGAVCVRHHPDRLPPEPVMPTTVDPGPNYTTEARKPRPGFPGPTRAAINEKIRKAIEISKAAGALVDDWIRSQADQEPHPVGWDWASWERDSRLCDSSCDITITYSDGHHTTTRPADLPAVSKPHGMQMEDLQENLLVQTPAREVLKVSTVDNERGVHAQVLYPMLPRTTVRYYTAEQVATWREPTKTMITKYEKAWGFDKR